MAHPNSFFTTKDVLTLVGVVASVVIPKLFFDIQEEVVHTVTTEEPPVEGEVVETVVTEEPPVEEADA